MDELEYRDAMVSSLARTLCGPSSPDDMSWLSQRQPTVVDDLYAPAGDRPIGPFVAPDGQEVLNVLPVSLYVTGLLYGPEDSTPAEVDEDDGDEVVEGDARVDMSNLVDDHNEDDRVSDELPADLDGLARRRSISTSFRVPSTVGTAAVELDFGSYTQYPVAEQARPWWKRDPHRVETEVDLTDSTESTHVIQGYRVTIGVIARATPNGDRLCTVWVRNDTTSEHISGRWVSHILFQTELRVSVADLLPYAPDRTVGDSLDLLYRDVLHRAIGHGCDVHVTQHDNGWTIRTDALPTVNVTAMTPDVKDALGNSYAVGMAAVAELNASARAGIGKMLDDYAQWIGDRSGEVRGLRPDALTVAQRHAAQWSRFLEDMRAGWQLVLNSPEVQQCFCDASSAMRSQRIAYSAELRAATLGEHGAVSFEDPSPHNGKAFEPSWRPFQLAFILASLSKVVDPGHQTRNEVDVIWMPTGGGKTEAYLGLAAFTILWERRQQTLGKQPTRLQGNTKVLMRYTLQLLTVQQLVRSASLVCALELIRKGNPDRYGATEVRLGAWVGNKLTPGSRASAMTKLVKAEKARSGQSAEFLLTRCPWCAAEMGMAHGGKVVGYGRGPVPNSQAKRLLPSCPDPSCAFTRRQELRPNGRTAERGIPVLETDEDIYDYPPDFVIGTVDKVATMWFATAAQGLFGLSGGNRVAAPPALFIQDELHLISGPLGSIDGVFEWMLEELCLAGDGGCAPAYVASTATTRNFESQIEGLYDRSSRLVPPPGLDIGDSFFARIDESQPKRQYLAISQSGSLSNAEVQVRVLATLAHFAGVLEDFGADPDPYWTDVSFFSSRRALGTLSSSAETKLGGFMDRIRLASGSSSGPIRDGQRRPRRTIRSPREITATGSEDVSKVLADLALRRDDKRCIDLCFATSMIEVGLDVGRLGLMTVIGQPKGSSQYIQVTGRVGRSKSAPALVVDVLGAHSPRDRSHYESFRAWHERLYASVESASVTPFTEQALSRSAPTVLAVLIQVLGKGPNISAQVQSMWPYLQQRLVQRAGRSGLRQQQTTARVLEVLYAKSQAPHVLAYTWARKFGSNQQGPPAFVFSFSDDVPDNRPFDYWQALTSMRSVDPDAPALVHANPLMGVAPTTAARVAVDSEENML